MDNDYYIEIPNQLFFGLNGKQDKSIYKNIKIKGNKKKGTDIYYNSYYTLLVLDYLYTNTNLKGETIFSIDDITDFCMLSRKQNKIIKDIIIGLESLCVFSDKRILEDIRYKVSKDKENEGKEDCNAFKFNSLVHGSLNLFALKDDGKKKWFSILYYSVKNKILNYDTQKVDNVALLFYYCYLNSRITRRKKGENIVKDGGMPEVCYPSYKLIHDDLGLTDDTISKYNKILQDDLHIILIGNPGLYQYANDKNKVVRESVNIYAIIENDDINTAKLNIKAGIKYWKELDINKDKIWKGDREYKNNNRKLNGRLGYLIKKEINNTATDEDIQEKVELIQALSQNEEVFKRLSLLNDEKKILLSDVYDDLNKPDKAEYFAKIEYSLGLVDDGELLVEWDYYKSMISNYTKDQHNYFVNCIAKHKREQMQLINQNKAIRVNGSNPKPKEFEDNEYWGEEAEEPVNFDDLPDDQKSQQWDPEEEKNYYAELDNAENY